MIEQDLENMKNILDYENMIPISTLKYVLLPKTKDEIIINKNNQNYIKSYFSQGVNPQNIVPTYLEDGIWTDIPKIKQNQFTNSILKIDNKYTEQFNQEIHRKSDTTQINSIIKSNNSFKKSTKKVSFELSETFPNQQQEIFKK
ncbi:unnamed protein product [Paramecium sonneborni]|uniref:Uncharacterized protein n=1 Tax=Paramecium sonneborni TaxID=65129 RepID=A0A8S1KPC0_9CILI|nr:unnamed protein product [Paramecium sonneborni]